MYRLHHAGRERLVLPVRRNEDRISPKVILRWYSIKGTIRLRERQYRTIASQRITRKDTILED